MKMKLALSTVATCLIASSAFAGPVSLTNAQMDLVTGGGESFVCPVISTEAVLHSPKAAALQDGLFYTILGPHLSVPDSATNTLSDGTYGSPGDAFASPGDIGYTAIWN